MKKEIKIILYILAFFIAVIYFFKLNDAKYTDKSVFTNMLLLAISNEIQFNSYDFLKKEIKKNNIDYAIISKNRADFFNEEKNIALIFLKINDKQFSCYTFPEAKAIEICDGTIKNHGD